MRVVDKVGFSVKKQEIPGGGSGSSGGNAQPLATPDWNQNDETAADYIKNRPFYTTDPMETELVNGRFAFTFMEGDGLYSNEDITIDLVEGQTYTVVFDGVEYDNLVCFSESNGASAIFIIGLKSIEEEAFASYPFYYEYYTNGTFHESQFLTNVEGENHDIIIKDLVFDYVPIPDKYIPKSVKATELSISVNGLVFSDTNKLVTFSDIDALINHEIILKASTSSENYYHKCLCIETYESEKYAYLIFAELSNSSSSFSSVNVIRYKINESGTVLDS